MKNNPNYAALSINDIIFLDRNKDYGAYELRESYNTRIKQALLGSLLLTVLACSYQMLYSLHHPVSIPKVIELVTTVNQVDIQKEAIKPPALVDPPKPQGTPDAATMTNGTIVPTTADQTTDTVPTNDQLADATIADHKGGTAPGSEVGIPTGTIDMHVATPPAPVITETVSVAEFMPEYPGGEQALLKFLGDHINYPDYDRQLGNQGRVIVGFIIDEKGKVGNITVVKGLTRGLNDESIRVVSLLKDFKPGVQGGHPVRVRYTLPISYHLSDTY